MSPVPPCRVISGMQIFHHVCIVPPEVINTSQPAPGQSLKAVTSFSDMVQRAARDARPSGTCHVCLPPPFSHILLMPPLVCLTDPPFKQQEVAKVLLSSDSSTGPVVCEALGALPWAIFPRDGAHGGKMSVEVVSATLF